MSLASRILVHSVLLTSTLAVAAAPAVASGGSSSSPCGDLTVKIVRGLVKADTVAPGWYVATGTTSRGCDGKDGYAITFTDDTPDDCVVVAADVLSSTYNPKYGTKPFSRYESPFQLGSWCAGKQQKVTATLTQVADGRVLSRASASVVPQ